jgi:hypothetical protein
VSFVSSHAVTTAAAGTAANITPTMTANVNHATLLWRLLGALSPDRRSGVVCSMAAGMSPLLPLDGALMGAGASATSGIAPG